MHLRPVTDDDGSTAPSPGGSFAALVRALCDCGAADPERRAVLLDGLRADLPVVAIPRLQLESDLRHLLARPTQFEDAFQLYLDRVRDDLGHAGRPVPEVIARAARGTIERAALDPQWQAFMGACRAHVDERVRRSRGKYRRELFVERAGASFERLGPGAAGEACLALIIDRAGSGKTNQVLHLAAEHVARHPTCLLVDHTAVLGPDDLVQQVVRLTPMPDEPARAVGWLDEALRAHDETLLVIVDAINEHPDPKTMAAALRRLIEVVAGLPARLVVTCRDVYWDLYRRRRWGWSEHVAARLEGELSMFTPAEFAEALPLYMAHFDVRGRLGGRAAQACHHPLLLRFFCEAHARRDVGEVHDIRRYALFEQYWRRKVEGVADRTADDYCAEQTIERALLTVAREMLTHRSRVLELGQVARITDDSDARSARREGSLYLRILDEDIILEEQQPDPFAQPVVAFVYEEFMEYVMARGLMAELAAVDDDAVFARVAELTDQARRFAHLFGVMLYLSIALRRAGRRSLWRVLVERGAPWPAQVCAALGKLGAEDLDDDVFSVVHDLLADGSPETIKPALELFRRDAIAATCPEPLRLRVLALGEHPQFAIRRRAITATARIGHPGGFGLLLCALSASQGGLRATAARGLARLDPSGFDAQRRGEAQWALLVAAGRRGDDSRAACRSAFIAWCGEADGLGAARRAVDAVGLDGRLAAGMAAGDLRVPSMLAVLGDRLAADALAAGLENGPPRDFRAACLNALVAVDPPRAAPYAEAFLSGDAEALVRHEAVTALEGALGAAAAPLIEAAWPGEPHLPTRAFMLETVRRLEPDAARRLAAGALRAEDYALREAAVRAIAVDLEAEGVEQSLLQALADPVFDVRRAAVQSVAGASAVLALSVCRRGAFDHDARVRAALGDVLAPHLPDTEATELLAGALHDDDGRVREAAALALGHAPSPSALALLRQGAGSGRWVVRRATAIGLGLRTEPEAWTLLGALAADGSARVRGVAVAGLAAGPAEHVTAPLMQALADPKAEIAAAAHGSLRRALGTRSDRILIERAGIAAFVIARGPPLPRRRAIARFVSTHFRLPKTARAWWDAVVAAAGLG